MTKGHQQASDKSKTLLLVATVENELSATVPKTDRIGQWINGMKQLGRQKDALQKLQAWARVHLSVPEFQHGIAVAAAELDDTSVAREAYVRLLELFPNNPGVSFELGRIERIAGNLERSQELISRALDLNPDNPLALRVYGADVTYVHGDRNFQRLGYAAANYESYSELEKIHLHFALAKAHEDVGELATAFRHYEVGGLKHRLIWPYDENDASRVNAALSSYITRARFGETGQLGDDSHLPVFILGMPRSGTSLLEQILSSHPQIYGTGEVTWLKRVLENIQFGNARLDMGEKEPLFEHHQAATWAERGQLYVSKLRSSAPQTALRIIDKMPGNFNFVGLIHAILPNATIIHSRRHPVETCLSCYRILFSEGHLWSYDLRELGRYYRRYWNLMKHWRTEFPDVMYEIRYEDLVADTEGQARKIISHLGLEWDDNCLKFYETDRPVKTASITQVRKPIYKTSVNRWRKYERFLQPLLEELGDVVQQYEAEMKA